MPERNTEAQQRDDLMLDEVRRSLHSPEAEERAGLHRQRVLLWAPVAVLPIFVPFVAGDWPDTMTWALWTISVIALAAAWRRVAEPWIVRDEQLVRQLAQASVRCPRCRTIVLPRDRGQCVRCDALVRPVQMVVAAMLACLVLIACIAWHIGRGRR